MTLRLSTGLRDAMLDYKAIASNLMVGTTISFGDGTGTDSTDQILDSGNGLAGFSVGDKITVSGSTSNDGSYEILAVAAGAIEIPAASLATEAAGDTVLLASARGGSLADLMKYGIIRIYSGSQPVGSGDYTYADAAYTGTMLVEISQSSGTFVSGTETNGLVMGEVTDSALKRESGEVWSGTAAASGTAGWFRFYANTVDDTASLTALRFDGAIATSGAQLNMSNTTITLGGTTTIDSVSLTQPSS